MILDNIFYRTFFCIVVVVAVAVAVVAAAAAAVLDAVAPLAVTQLVVVCCHCWGFSHLSTSSHSSVFQQQQEKLG